MFGTGETFTYAECADCGTLTIQDPPADLATAYPPEYLSMGVDPVAIGLAGRLALTALARSSLMGSGRIAAGFSRVTRNRQVRALVDILGGVAGALRGHTVDRVLDVGCGSGIIPYVVSLGVRADVVGIDPHAPRSQPLGARASLRTITLEEVDGQFSVVMFHHSLEHVADPLRALRQAQRVLAPGGSILVRVPTAASYAWRTYGTQWIQLDPPRHLWLPSRRGLDALAARAGLAVVHRHDDANEFQFWGSEQARRGIALMDPRSEYVSTKQSTFSRREITDYRRRSAELNAAGDGDQTVVVLEPIDAASSTAA